MPDGVISIDRPIALIGMMASGKSTVAGRLARRLNVPFVDSDEEIERETGRKVGEIFDRSGESYFRALEREFIERLDFSRPMILATGGGMFADSEIRDRLIRRCHTIWLDPPIELLAKRVGAGEERPLLSGGNVGEILACLAESRRPAYALAELRIETGSATPDEIAERIVVALDRLRR